MLYINSVKKESFSLLLAVLAMNAPGATNTAPDSEKKAIDLLRETIYQYERRRGALLPPPTLSTNGRRGTNTAVANVPSQTIPWSGAPPVANVRPPSRATTPTPPPATTPLEGTAPAHETTLAELERLYLEGKITAKQFQKYLQQHEQQRQTAATRTPEAAVAPAARQNPPANQTTAPRQPAPPKTTAAPARRAAPPAAPDSPDQAAISEVEKKMDELIQAKAIRDQQATNVANAATNAVAAGPKTQRQKLDELLRFYIEGKVTDAEYKERREKILAEPSAK